MKRLKPNSSAISTFDLPSRKYRRPTAAKRTNCAGPVEFSAIVLPMLV